jgi:hypothetical protein
MSRLFVRSLECSTGKREISYDQRQEEGVYREFGKVWAK